MKLSSFFALLFASLSIATILEERQDCNEDDCLRAVNGTRRGPSHPATGTSHCIDYLTTTVLVDPVITTTTETLHSTITSRPPCPTSLTSSDPTETPTPTPAPNRIRPKRRPVPQDVGNTLETTHGTIPFYATSACSNERYSSACSCLGVASAQISMTSLTVTRTYTTTIIGTAVGSCVSEYPKNATTTTTPTTLSNSTTSIPTTSSTFNITFSFNSSTTTTIITLTSTSGTGTGTTSSSISPSTTPPFANTTTSFESSSSSTSTYANTTTFFNATSTATTTTSPEFPTPTVCGGTNVALCSGTCSELENDVQNCGSCGNRCSEGNFCTNGVCTSPPCDSTCLNQRACGPAESTCICGTETGGAGICFEGSGFCNDFDSCTSTEDCVLGFVCVPTTCCGRGKCLSTDGCDAGGSVGLGPVRKVERNRDMFNGKLGAANLLGGYIV
ncbi:hypothetical protein K505DRAFT_337428 [Melanomma pulvis-pyrius CBS 109.77]|uniref:Uncharacterized protein n=1 Tax=Melanomma pulvis-pyrius CBS 109.77 TaxID=1314802 RepID=A0A6A6XBF3_9PLEO|nr:hypothetical protein K505DRAFT_337428 [Melanomma pulvis-pyrius CBS 109.77]